MDDDMPDFLDEAPEGGSDERGEAMLDEEDDLEAGLLAELDEEEPGKAGPAAAAEGGEAEAPPPQPPGEAPLPLTADGYVDMDRLTTAQRNKVTNTIVGLMTEDQLDRYEAFRRSSLKRPMRQLVKTVTNSSANPNDKLMIAVSSVAKTFVGDLIESARLVATERGDEGPLQPLHIHAAYQRLKDQGRMPSRGGGARRRPFV